MRYIVLGNDFGNFVYEDLVMRNTYEIIRRYRDILGSVTRYDLKNQQTGKIESFTSAQAIIIREYIINDWFPKLLEGDDLEIAINEHIPIELPDNGYRDGYSLLHGTDASVGGFHIKGTLTKTSDHEINGDFRYAWNDIIDPNGKYIGDIIRSIGLKMITFGSPKDYVIRIPFQAKFTATRKDNDTPWIMKGFPGL